MQEGSQKSGFDSNHYNLNGNDKKMKDLTMKNIKLAPEYRLH